MTRSTLMTDIRSLVAARRRRSIRKEHPMARTGFFALLSLMLLAGPAAAAPILEVESNDSIGSAQAIGPAAFTLPSPLNAFGNHPTASISGQLSGTNLDGDVDFYSFSSLAGQSFYFDIDDTPFGSLLGLALFDPSGLLIAASIGSDLDPGSVEFDPFIGTIQLTAAGVYTIGVFDLIGVIEDISAAIPLAATVLFRADGADGGVSFGPAVASLTPTMAFSDTPYTLHVTAAAAAVPEPAMTLLMLAGMTTCGVAALRRRRSNG